MISFYERHGFKLAYQDIRAVIIAMTIFSVEAEE